MLKLLNPYLALGVIAGGVLLFGGGYWKGMMDGKNSVLSQDLKNAHKVIEKTNDSLTLKREIKHEGQKLDHNGIVNDLCVDDWMRDKSDCSK